MSRNSTYVPLLFEGIEARYQRIYREDGSLQDAIAELGAGCRVVVHVHWEEFVLRECESEAQADEVVASFSRDIARIVRGNGSIVWTIHNELPHLIRFDRHFLLLRAVLAAHADVVLVHNRASIEVLRSQVVLDDARVRVIPHPSYLGRFEDEGTLRAGLADPHDRRIQGFGWIRLQKGFGEMIGMLPPRFLRSRDACIRISGEGVEAAAVIAQQSARTDVEWDLRHVPDREVPRLLRGAACVVLPYERVLTSGVALVAMSVGAMVVAVDVPQLRELLPERSHRFLYPRGDARALRRRVDAVFTLSAAERRDILTANLAVAREVHPSNIARRLAHIYDETIARRLEAP